MKNVPIIITSKDTDGIPAEFTALVKRLCKKYDLKSVILHFDASEKDPATMLVEIGPYKLKGTPSSQQLEIAICAALDRQKQTAEIFQKRNGRKIKDPYLFGFWDKFGLWCNKHYLAIINISLALFILFSFLAPILMKLGMEDWANSIYAFYKILCHQLAFRSFFLFGTQAVYPRELAHLGLPITYESLMGGTSIDILQARNFLGDTYHGYKVALCERDIAMYGSFLICGMIFVLIKEKLRNSRLWVWLIFGLIPIALDGGTQLLGFGLNVQWFPERESTPLLRILTGVMFGVFTAWYLFPLLSEAIHDKRKELLRKRDISVQLK